MRSGTAPTIVNVVSVLTGVTAIAETVLSADGGVLRAARYEVDRHEHDGVKSHGAGVSHFVSISGVARPLVKLLASAGGSAQNRSGTSELESAQRKSRARQSLCRTFLITA